MKRALLVLFAATAMAGCGGDAAVEDDSAAANSGWAAVVI